MSLSSILKAEATRLAANKFALEILNRLRVVEAECAYFLYQKPLYKLYRPYSSTSSSHSLLTLMDALADLIHKTYIADLQHKSKNQLKTIFNGMFPRKNINEIETAIIDYVNDCNIKIAHLNQTNQRSDQLALIEKLLIECFPKINRSSLSAILIQISRLSESLATMVKGPTNTLAVTESSSAREPEEELPEIDDFVQVKNISDKNRFFSMNGGNAHSVDEEKQVCTIC